MASGLDSGTAAGTAPVERGSGQDGKAILAILLEEWKRIFRREDIGIHDDFFGLGGDSIMSIQAASFVSQRGLMVNANLIYRHPTLAGLAEALQADPVPVREESEAAWDLTPIQAWFFDQRFPDMHHWNQALGLKTREDLDSEGVLLALEDVIQAHPALHSRFFRAADGRWKQGLTDAMPEYDLLEVFDARGADPARVDRLCAEGLNGLHRKFNLQEGTLIRAGLFLLPGSGQMLALVAHHLVVDAVSWRVILEDFEQAYRKRMAGEEGGIRVISSPPSSYPRHLEALRALRKPEPGERSAESRPIAAASATGSRIRLRKSWTEPATDKLLRQASGLKAGLEEILVVAFRRALLGTPFGSAPMARETHGRDLGRADGTPDRDFSRTVGWFTGLEPIVAQDAGGDLLEAVKASKSATRAGSTPPAPDPSAFARLASGVVINYLGDLDSAIRHSRLFCEVEVDPGETMGPHTGFVQILELNAWLSGARLHFELCYDSLRVAAGLGVAVLAGLSDGLEAIAEMPPSRSAQAWLPSDFPSAGLAPECLAALEPFLADAETILPCSGMQAIMLLDTERTREAGMFTIQVAFDLVGDLDADAFQGAFSDLYRRHQALRCSFHWKGLRHPVQIVHADAVPKPRFLSLAGEEPRKRDRKIEILLDRDYSEAFRLEQAPLMRLYLVRMAPDRMKVIWTSHHLPTDGWSFPILIRDLFRSYRIRNGEAPAPPPPAGRYEDFLAWLSRQSLPASLDFWEAYLTGFSGRKLILAEPDPRASHRRDFRESEADLAQAASRHGVTPGTVLLASWAAGIALREGIQDIVFGLVFANRPPELAQIGETVGMFINAVPVRVRFPSQGAETGTLPGLHRQLGRMQEHGYVTNAEIRERLGMARNEVLYDTVVNILNYPESDMDGADLGGLRVENRFYRERNATPMTVQIYLKPFLRVEVKFDPDRFPAADVEAALDAFASAIGRMAGRGISVLPDRVPAGA